MKYLFSGLLFAAFIFQAAAQVEKETDKESKEDNDLEELVPENRRVITSEWASPGVEGSRRSKGIVFNYERTLPYTIQSFSDSSVNIGDGAAKIQKNEWIRLKLRGPVYNKERTKLVLELKYYYQEFNFENKDPDYPLYRNLENKHLNTLGGGIIFLHSLSQKNYILLRGAGDLNGDYNKKIKWTKFFKGSLVGLYGWKLNKNLSFGAGAAYSYSFGKPALYPVLLYSRTLNEKWGIEALFPAEVLVRYSLSKRTILLAGYELAGSSYHMVFDNPEIPGYEALELRRSEARGVFIIEQEIHDWLWMNFNTGYKANISFYFSKDNESRFLPFTYDKDKVISNDIGNSFFFNIGIFIVPPRDMDKILGRE